MDKVIVDYKISLYPSRFLGHQAKKGKKGTIILYIYSLWNECKGNFDKFVLDIVYTSLLERICLERAFNKIRMKNRCKPFCKMEKYAIEMLGLI